MKYLLFIILNLALFISAKAQSGKDSLLVVDTIKRENPLDYKPTRISKAAYASLLSAALPGAGQVYNRSYWQIKLPIIYTGFTVLTYLIISNHDNFRAFRQVYISRKDENPNTITDALYASYSDESVLRQRDQYRRDRDFYMILTLLWYTLNVAEAATTSHLNEFSVKDDISFRLQPNFKNVGGINAVGLGITMPLFSHKKAFQQRKIAQLTLNR